MDKETVRRLLESKLKDGEKLPHSCYKSTIARSRVTSKVKTYSNAEEDTEVLLEFATILPSEMETALKERRSGLIVEDNFSQQVNGTFTLDDLVEACQQYNKDNNAHQQHLKKSMATMSFFVKKGMSRDKAQACAYAISFYTGYNSEHVNRGASLIVRKGNGSVSEGVDTEQYFPIMYYLINALSNLPFYWGPTVRAIQLQPEEIDSYNAGDIVTWYQFSSSKKDSEVASGGGFAQRNSIFFIHSLTGRRIQQFSNFENEDEVLYLPHSCFLVVSKKQEKDKWHFHLRQVELGLSSKNVLWVDDNILNADWENKKLMEDAASEELNHNVHFIPKTNTNAALSFLKSPFAQQLKNTVKLRIVTDMTRNNEKPAHNAGARFICELRKLGFTNEVLVFTSNNATAKQYIEQECKGVRLGNVKISVASADLREFVRFN